MKGSLQFEGVRAGGDGYSSGFGVVAEPDTTLTELTGECVQTSQHTRSLDACDSDPPLSEAHSQWHVTIEEGRV